MTTQPPPSRYRVVEKGRRLVVIDTLTGEPATSGAKNGATTPVATPLIPARPERTAFDGRSRLVTHPIYDDRGPRALDLDEGATLLINGVRVCLIGGAIMLVIAAIFLPWLIIVPVILLNPKTRAAIRAPVTAWLDRYDADTSTG